MDPNSKTVKWKKIDVVMWILVIIGGMVFFHNVLFSDRLIGNNIDGRLLTMFVEHWYHVFQGNAVWTELPSFFPAEGVLSYSDMMLGFAIPYSVLRIFGVGKYVAFKYVVILTHMVGAFAMYYFCRQCLQVHSFSAMLAVITFFYSNGFYFVIGNAQMVAQALVPVFCILLFQYFQEKTIGKRYVYGIGASLLLVLLFYTAFYVAYYLVLLVAIVIVMLGIFALPSIKQAEIRQGYVEFFSRWKDYVLYILLAGALLIPMIQLYLPTLHDIGGRQWEEVALYSPDVKGAMGFQANNIMQLDENLYNLRYGMPLIQGVFLLLCIIVCGKMIHKESTRTKIVYWTLCGVAILCFILPIMIHGYSLWYLIWKVVPGASALRAMDRWIAFAMYPIAIVFAVTTNQMIKKNAKWGGVFALGLMAVIFGVNYSTIGCSSGWTTSEAEEFEESVATPPKGCEVFYIVDTSDQNTWGEEFQMDAWTIAEKYGLKTINGYSGQVPEDWALDILADDYEENVKSWIQKNNINTEHLYIYKERENVWEKYEE